MNVINNIRQLRSWGTINKGTRCAFVPTMGALHEGHAALIRAARETVGQSGNVVVSIFVNPLQFGPEEDFAKYPRSLIEDLGLCRDNGADAIFAPKAEDLYLADRSIQLFETSLSKTLWIAPSRKYGRMAPTSLWRLGTNVRTCSLQPLQNTPNGDSRLSEEAIATSKCTNRRETFP